MDRFDLPKELYRECPLTVKAFLSRKFVLPAYRAADYYDQDELNKLTLMMLAAHFSPREADDIVRSQLLNIFQALHCDRPVLFLERELGEILARTEIPGVVDSSDIHFPFPSFRVMMPKGLIGLEAQKRYGMFLDIGHLPANVEVGCPKPIAAELDTFARDYRLPLTRSLFVYPEHVLVISSQLDRGHASSYAVTKPLKGSLEEFKEFKGKLSTDYPNDSEDDAFLAQMQRLAINILLILSSMPVEYEPLTIERKARVEGKRTIPALARAKWIGDHLLRAKREGHVKGEIPSRSVPAHWVCGHWRHQPHGKGFALRKLIYILPYRTGNALEL